MDGSPGTATFVQLLIIHSYVLIIDDAAQWNSNLRRCLVLLSGSVLWRWVITTWQQIRHLFQSGDWLHRLWLLGIHWINQVKWMLKLIWREAQPCFIEVHWMRSLLDFWLIFIPFENVHSLINSSISMEED